MHPTDAHVGQRVRTRRLMLGLSQTTLADALGLSFQQVQKYEKGANRIGAGRLQHIAQILQVPVTFFFEGAPHVRGKHHAQTDAPSPQYVTDYLATPDGLHLTKAFMQIPDAKLRRSIVNLVEQIADSEDQ
jgi:transcriptional regulator with XRE-family HTH domain